MKLSFEPEISSDEEDWFIQSGFNKFIIIIDNNILVPVPKFVFGGRGKQCKNNSLFY